MLLFQFKNHQSLTLMYKFTYLKAVVSWNERKSFQKWAKKGRRQCVLKRQGQWDFWWKGKVNKDSREDIKLAHFKCFQSNMNFFFLLFWQDKTQQPGAKYLSQFSVESCLAQSCSLFTRPVACLHLRCNSTLHTETCALVLHYHHSNHGCLHSFWNGSLC